MQRHTLKITTLLLALVALGAAASEASGWQNTLEIDPAGIAKEADFMARLKAQGLQPGGQVNKHTGRLAIAFIGGHALGVVSEDLEFFYEKPFRYWTHVLDYIMDGGGSSYGIRARIRLQSKQPLPKQRSYLLTYNSSTLTDYHPSYILCNGRRIWDCKRHPLQEGRIIVPFYEADARELMIDFVVDSAHSPEIKGLGMRRFSVQYLGPPGTGVSLKDTTEQRESSPADKLERFAFGLFPAKFDFYSQGGIKIKDLKERWQPNFRPDYPVEGMYLSPASFEGRGKGAYHDFMISYGGCNVGLAGAQPQALEAAGSYLRGALATNKDVEAARRALQLAPGIEAIWFGGEDGALVAHGKDTEEARTERMKAAPAAVAAAKEATGAPDRVKNVYAPYYPALTCAHEYERGVDLMVVKNQEGPQYNIMLAMARGAGRSFNKPFGFFWEQTQYPHPSLDFKLQALLLYYFSGASWISADQDSPPSFEAGTIVDWAYPFVQAQRFAMLHPARGTPIVPIGILWTYGDRWCVPYSPFAILGTFQRHLEYDHGTKSLKAEPKFTKLYPWIPKDPKTWHFGNAGHHNYFYGFEDELRGYDLLDVFFPQYGDALSARMTRLLTGTTYGPVDFCYAQQASAEQLKTYGLTAVLGHANMSAEFERKLTVLLESGTPVLIGAQHFKDFHGKPVSGFGLEFKGEPVTVQGEPGGIPELVTEAGGSFSGRVFSTSHSQWQTVAWIGASRTPLVIRRTVGKGELYVYLGEWIAQGGVVLRPILHKLAAAAAPLAFEPSDDQLEYMAYRKGAGAWVAVFNHGAIQIGCDRLEKPRAQPPEPLRSEVKGPWRGQVSFALPRLGLSANGEWSLYEVEGIDGAALEKVISGHTPFKLNEIACQQQADRLTAKVKINKRAQYVIAPKGQGHAVFFGKAE